MSSYVYGVHTVLPQAVTLTAVIFHRRGDAERHARELSGDPGVLAASVTEYIPDELGRRTPVARYVNGVRQVRGHISDDHTVHARSR